MAEMVTLKDIAAHAGVSVSATSLALRDHHSISQATKQRVWTAQEKLGYHRHKRGPLSRKMSSAGRTRNIAFLLVDRSFKDLSYAEEFEGVASTVSGQGFLPVYLSAKSEDVRKGRFPAPLKNREIDGIIVSGLYDEEEHRQLKGLGIPIVVLGNYDLGVDPWAACEIDHRGAIRLMMDRMSDLGHHRLGLLDCSSALEVHNQIKATYLDRIAKKGLEDAGIAVVEGDSDIRGPLRELLEKPNRPTALVIPLVGEAKAVYAVCEDLGLKIPEDISIIFHGQSDRSVTPSTATIHVEMHKFAGSAVAKLTEAIDNPDCLLTREIFPARFFPGGSIGKCKK